MFVDYSQLSSIGATLRRQGLVGGSVRVLSVIDGGAGAAGRLGGRRWPMAGLSQLRAGHGLPGLKTGYG